MSNSNNSMMPQQYCLRWRYHHSNLQTMFSQLLEREAFCDVTLACDGRTIKAHKIVLSACSTYFDTILSQYEEKDPILIMKDVKFVDIKCLVEFMYKGEINVEHTHLATLLKTAEDLRIKGLAEVSWRDSAANSSGAAAASSNAAAAGSTSTASSSNNNTSTSTSHNGIQHALANVATVMGTSPKEGAGGGGGGGVARQHLLQQQLTMNKRKRGRPPIDDYEQPGYTLAPKIVSVMSGSNAEESASNDDGTSASDHDNDMDHQGGQGSGQQHRGGSSSAGGGKASGSSQWDDDDVDRINSFGEHMLSGIRVKTELNTEDEYIDYDQATAGRSRSSTNASQLNNSTSGTANNSSGNPAGAGVATFNISQLEKEWPDVIRLNDYLNTGRRQQFWEEPFTKRVMDAIKTKNLEMKSAAELLGVSYGTLYGRYRDAYGCLKHPYSLSRSGLLVKVPGSMTPNANPGGTANWIRDAWSDQGSTDIIMKLKRKEITLFKAAEQLKMTPQALSNYLISFSMGMDPEMANTVAKLLAQQSAEEGVTGGGQTSQLQLQLQQGQLQMPPLRRLHSSRSHEDDGSILGDDDDEAIGEDEDEDEEEEEEVVFSDQHHQQRARHHQLQRQQQNDDDDDDDEDSILPDIPMKSTNHHSIIGKPSALANCPDITIIRKEKLDQLISSSRVNNNDHSEQRGGSSAGLKPATTSNNAAGTAT